MDLSKLKTLLFAVVLIENSYGIKRVLANGKLDGHDLLEIKIKILKKLAVFIQKVFLSNAYLERKNK